MDLSDEFLWRNVDAHATMQVVVVSETKNPPQKGLKSFSYLSSMGLSDFLAAFPPSFFFDFHRKYPVFFTLLRNPRDGWMMRNERSMATPQGIYYTAAFSEIFYCLQPSTNVFERENLLPFDRERKFESFPEFSYCYLVVLWLSVNRL